MKHCFDKLVDTTAHAMNTEFSKESIMLYSGFWYIKDPKKPTLTLKSNGVMLVI